MDCNKIPCFEGKIAASAQAREETLAEMQQKSTAMSDEILSLVHMISAYFFGSENLEPEEKRAMPDCFRNDLSLDILTQTCTLDVLHKMVERLGA